MSNTESQPSNTETGMSPGPIEINFSGQSVLVTGGSRGIGKVICEAFLSLGADVTTCGRNEPDEAPTAAGRTARFIACDVRDPEQVDALVSAIEKETGRVDVLINNAGGSPSADAATASPRFSEAIIGLNLIAPLHLAQRCNATMQNQETGGSIVNIASVSAIRPSPGTAAYGAAKAGLLSLTQTLAVEWAPKVRVNAITCGIILTEGGADLFYGGDEGVERVAQTIPMQRLGTPTDVANACAYLASPLSSYVSGGSVLMHGGGETPAFLAAAEG